MAQETFPVRFSIIIPLEFHRGQAEACLRSWAFDQAYARDQYEIIAAGCEHSLDEQAHARLKACLGPQDRLLLCKEPHDMSLCSQAAKQAQGKILIFTESHCHPERNAISLADEILRAHPEWAGFSGRTLPITHNRLSVVEAEMYAAEIENGVQKHPWRTILDGFFLVQAEAYQTSGGFRAQLGHFAEWHLAARMHQQGHRIGFAPELTFKHYYVGDAKELIDFSADFARGELTYHLECTDDPCHTYFQEPAEWVARFQHLPRLARRALQLSASARPKKIPRILPHGHEIANRSRLLLAWGKRLYCGFRIPIAWAYIQFHAAVWGLRLRLWRRAGRHPLLAAFLRMIDATIRLERLRFVLRKQTEIVAAGNRLSAAEPAAAFRWEPSTPLPFNSIGFQPVEEWNHQHFRWSEPVGMIEVCLRPGNYQFALEWLPIKKIRDVTVYLDEQALPTSLEDCKASGHLQVRSAQPIRFAWTCGSWRKDPKDPRMLGVPLVSIALTPLNQPVQTASGQALAAAQTK